jgi:hypothetical protein
MVKRKKKKILEQNPIREKYYSVLFERLTGIYCPVGISVAEPSHFDTVPVPTSCFPSDGSGSLHNFKKIF